MKIFNRWFVPPIGISASKSFGTEFFGRDRTKGLMTARVFCRRMAGTTETTTWTAQFSFGERRYEFSFCWRPDVTRYWWKDSAEKKEEAK